jgi:hypothetical protein
VVLPPMLVWADKRNWVSRGLIDKPQEPFIETPTYATHGAAATTPSSTPAASSGRSERATRGSAGT